MDKFTLINAEGSPSSTAGLLLFKGGTVCNDGWENNKKTGALNAAAVCGKMGLGGQNARWFTMGQVSYVIFIFQDTTITNFTDF